MSAEDRPALLERVRAFCARPPHAVLFDETGETLFDVRSVKTLPLRSAELAGVFEEVDRQTGQRWLRLRYRDGHELGLTAAGLAFAPGFQSSGPLPELPAAVCLGDLSLLLDRVRHALDAHPETAPGAELARALLCGIAIAEGARAVGLEVEREERALDALLSELERRR